MRVFDLVIDVVVGVVIMGELSLAEGTIGRDAEGGVLILHSGKVAAVDAAL